MPVHAIATATRVAESSSAGAASAPPPAPRGWRRHVRLTTVLLTLVHLTAVLGAVYYWSWQGLALAVGVYFVRMFVVTAAYHRYFAHRAFKTSRPFQLLLAIAAQSAAQRGVIWWASHHRWHHKHSDTPRDVHSARLRGFWYSHMGWLLSDDWTETDSTLVADLRRFPELRFLNRAVIEILPTVALALGFLLIGGAPALIWGYMVSTVLLWHGSFAINSLSHVFGRQRYATGDGSRNSFLLALLTTGEGWHNNHHHYPSSANQGFRWWEVDVTYYLLRAMSLVGLVWDLRRPPRAVVAATMERPATASMTAPVLS
jgi:stearoyl-CoA desaturase (delta-9 desaturase)